MHYSDVCSSSKVNLTVLSGNSGTSADGLYQALFFPPTKGSLGSELLLTPRADIVVGTVIYNCHGRPMCRGWPARPLYIGAADQYTCIRSMFAGA